MEKGADLFVLHAAVVLDGILQEFRLVSLGIGDEVRPVLRHGQLHPIEGHLVLKVVIDEFLPIRRPGIAEHLADFFQRRQSLCSQFGSDRASRRIAVIVVVALVPSGVEVLFEMRDGANRTGRIFLRANPRQERIQHVHVVSSGLVLANPGDDRRMVIELPNHVPQLTGGFFHEVTGLRVIPL